MGLNKDSNTLIHSNFFKLKEHYFSTKAFLRCNYPICISRSLYICKSYS